MRRRLKEWTGGAIVLVVLTALYLWHGGASALYMLLLTGLIAVSGVLMQCLGPRRVTIKRQMSQSVIPAGETAVMQVEVSFRSFLPVPWLAVEDYYTGGSSRQVLFPGFRRSLTYSCELRGLPRGVYSFDACLLEWGGLFGWFKGGRVQRSEGRLLVLPRPLPIASALELPAASAQAAQQPVQTAEHRNGAKSPEVREYMPSDPLNRIHWKSSAKRGSLYTCIPEDERDLFCLVILDCSRQGYVFSEDTEEQKRENRNLSFENAVSAASGILGEMMRTGARGRLICGALDTKENSITNMDEERAASSRDDYTRILAALSPVRLGEGPPLSSIMDEALKKTVPGTRVIVVTGRLDHQAAEAAARMIARGIQVDFYCTAAYGQQGSLNGGKQDIHAGSGSSFATAVRLSRMGAGMFAVDQDRVTRIGLVDRSPQGEGVI
ncbi:DUF58 domain-containing protein [Paenibacillus sp. KQZ6P-2]|uniref:DUF58 domain-containing protein n=1 Tax=Paenibacillus mangrovi TaxID=2931978 RepID=A0A9X2B2A4_9BACL|nr:DUF58 domain-containing protein [Paenibacillus mangrovi]MCJ8011730.1 DUF58 domain-containing protein [Paenibacillus mangrovi]